jgi:PAS domain S-box-containing protein
MSSANTLSPPDTHTFRFRRLQFGVAAIGSVVILAFAGSSAYDAWRSYTRTVRSTERELGSMANALAEQTVWSLQAVDLLLLDAARWYRSDGRELARESRNSVPEVNATLASLVAGVKQVRQVSIMDEQGNQIYHSRDVPALSHNIADRSYFVAQRDDPNRGLFMSEPLTTRTEGRTAVILSRRFNDEQGHFAGIVAANVDLEDLNRFYQAVDTGPGSHIGLLRDDGTLLVRTPRLPSIVGRKFPVLTTVPPGPDARIVNPIDGHKNFIAVVPVRGSPLILTVTRDADIALQTWRDETIRVAIRTLIVALLGSLLLALLLRQIKRVASGQRALRESEERYALAMEGANEGHWDWDVTADRLFLSPQMKVLDGQSVDAPVGSGTEWVSRVDMHAEDRPRFEATLRDHLEGRAPRFECEFRVRHPDGEWHWLLARGRCFFDEAFRPMRFVGSAMDISAQKRAQTEKEHLESQLRQSQKMEAMGTLAGGIAHDFNNVLGAILGYGELATQQAGQNTALRRYLDNVMHAAERAKTLVERILGFSRSGLGDQVQVNVQSEVNETLELLAASLPIGVRLETHLEAGNAAVIGDPTYLHQVTMNLCTNAVQAMEHGGVLGVSVERVKLRAQRTLARGSLLVGDYVRLTVTDTGAGIAPEVLERVFDPFFTTKAINAGTGLGLSLVHGIVADLGGAIDVWSKVGEGTRFEIWLPVAGEMPVDAAEPARSLPRGKGETVMIVDDERALVELAEEIIARLGYEPVGFVSSTLALQAFNASPERFDAVITDEMMPDLVGTELAREIRHLRPSIPILLMSGRAVAQVVERATDIGVNEVLRKPLHGRDIAESLARVLESA